MVKKFDVIQFAPKNIDWSTPFTALVLDVDEAGVALLSAMRCDGKVTRVDFKNTPHLIVRGNLENFTDRPEELAALLRG